RPVVPSPPGLGIRWRRWLRVSGKSGSRRPRRLSTAGRAAWDNAGMAERPLVGLSLMLEEDFLRAALPLFEAGEIEVLEWSFDVGWGLPALPTWADELLACY